MPQVCALPGPAKGQGQLFAEALDILAGLATRMCSRLLAVQEAVGEGMWANLGANGLEANFLQITCISPWDPRSLKTVFEPSIPDYSEGIFVKVKNRIYFILIYNFLII